MSCVGFLLGYFRSRFCTFYIIICQIIHYFWKYDALISLKHAPGRYLVIFDKKIIEVIPFMVCNNILSRSQIHTLAIGVIFYKILWVGLLETIFSSQVKMTEN